MKKVNPDGFRKDLESFFNQFVLSIPTKDKQPTPFIIINDLITKCNTVEDLLKYKNDIEVLQIWPGAKRSDVFYFTIKDLKQHIKDGGK